MNYDLCQTATRPSQQTKFCRRALLESNNQGPSPPSCTEKISVIGKEQRLNRVWLGFGQLTLRTPRTRMRQSVNEWLVIFTYARAPLQRPFFGWLQNPMPLHEHPGRVWWHRTERT